MKIELGLSDIMAIIASLQPANNYNNCTFNEPEVQPIELKITSDAEKPKIIDIKQAVEFIQSGTGYEADVIENVLKQLNHYYSYLL